ncbi:MAG: ATP-binding protein [Leptolyngbyaceae bacterium]|nr:ATP-binding protein [Leptolyngbyaceae bacterium]
MQHPSDCPWDTLPSQTIETLRYRAASLLLYASVLDNAVGRAFLDLLQHCHEHPLYPLKCVSAYGQWFHALADVGMNWPDYLLAQVLTTENPFTRYAQQMPVDQLPDALTTAARHDLKAIHQISQCTIQQVGQWIHTAASLPDDLIPWDIGSSVSLLTESSLSDRLRSHDIWQTLMESDNWANHMGAIAHHYHQHGTGLPAQYHALRWANGALIGIANPDPIQLAELTAYDIPRQALIQNTEALISGYRALHVLLYGSRGSGKSSLVKALVNHYGDRGLRLIEVGKHDLKDLPLIVDQLRFYPQRFIIFVDDLSFEDDDDAFKALKVVLEGSVTARPQNVVVYATSNRRHLIREFHAERPRPRDADEIHAWDTLQEKLSFSDRFGLTLTFEPADQPTYLTIIHHLAQQENIQLDQDELDYRALQWATRHNGRSGRTARQFIDALKPELNPSQ